MNSQTHLVRKLTSVIEQEFNCKPIKIYEEMVGTIQVCDSQTHVQGLYTDVCEVAERVAESVVDKAVELGLVKFGG